MNNSAFLLLIVVIVSLALFEDQPKGKPLSLPEEIQAVKTGDTLVVSKVADSIYIQFK